MKTLSSKILYVSVVLFSAWVFYGIIDIIVSDIAEALL